MTTELLLAFAAYAFVTSITPGPNNTMLLASGVNFGFGPTIPHILGVCIGFAAMVMAVGLGAGTIFVIFPLLHEILRYGGALYLIYLAWQIATSGPLGSRARAGKPFGFLQAAAFQWINPKAWIMAIGAVAAYTPQNGYFFNIMMVSLIYLAINGPCVAAWAGFGTALRGILRQPLYLRAFNIVMAVLLVASLYPLLAHA